jgi:hypothetical protein
MEPRPLKTAFFIATAVETSNPARIITLHSDISVNFYQTTWCHIPIVLFTVTAVGIKKPNNAVPPAKKLLDRYLGSNMLDIGLRIRAQ